MSVAAIDFDPYRDWLKISDSPRPLNPYQLLRLPQLEADLIRIRAAYDRQMELLERQSQSGDQDLLQSLRNELNEAFDTLCDSDRKGVVDGGIRRRANTSVPQPSAEAISTAGTNIQCPRCSKSNSTNRRFCGDCGQPLWEKCPQCSAECAADERFCGECGANIRGELDERERSIRGQIQAAEQAIQEYRFDAAISQYRQVAAIDDVRFAALAQQAIQAIAATESRRQVALAAAQQALTLGRDFVAAHSYEQAISVLMDVPERLRSNEHSDLLAQAQSARQELLQLTGEIRQGMEAKNYDGLLLKIERLLALKPNHTQAQNIGGQLRDHFFKLGKQQVTARQYSAALTILEQIPELVRNPEVRSLEDLALELFALESSLTEAALAETLLVPLADKFVKFAPHNEEAPKLRQKLISRLSKKASNERLEAPDWQPSPLRSAVGPPVDWLGHFVRLPAGDDEIKASLREHPGDLFIALGLALQGVELAEIPLNLLTVEKGSVLSRLKSVFARKGPAFAWGIDIGDHALKAIKLRRDEKTGAVQIVGCEYILHDKQLAGADADLIRAETFEKTLKDFAGRTDLKGCQVIAAMPAARVLGRFVQLPPLPAKKVPAAVQYEARHQFPVAIDELQWAYDVLEEAPGKAADESPRQIMIVAARSAHVQERLQLFKRAGIEIQAMQSECVALHNAVRHEFAPEPPVGNKTADKKAADKPQPEKAPEKPAEKPAGNLEFTDRPLLLVDVGVNSTSVVVSSGKGLWFRTFGQGGNSFTTQLLKQFQLTHEQAEQLKRAPAKARRYHQFVSALQPALVQMAGEVNRSLLGYHKQHPGEEVSRIYGLGGGFRTHGLLRQLRFGK